MKPNKHYQSVLRGFFRFLHYECAILDKDLSSQIDSAPVLIKAILLNFYDTMK